MADNQGTIGSIDDTIGVNANIGKYAAVVPQKLEWETNTWNILWYEVEPGMDFAYFSGNPDQDSRVRDSNCFLVETNCSVVVTFDGTPLTNVVDNTVTLPTTYWVWESLDVNDIPLTSGLFADQLLPPYQLIPVSEIGYIGDSLDIPKNNLDFSNPFGNFLDTLLDLVTNEIWPSPDKVASSRSYDGINEKGVFAFQLFGFAGMRDNISDVKAGDYVGEIRLTVAVND